MSIGSGLSRRERQIMDILYQRGKLSAADVREAMPDTPRYPRSRHAPRPRREGPRETPGRRSEVCLRSTVAARQGKALGRQAPARHLLRGFARPDCRGAARCLRHQPHARRTRPHVGNDQKVKKEENRCRLGLHPPQRRTQKRRGAGRGMAAGPRPTQPVPPSDSPSHLDCGHRRRSGAAVASLSMPALRVDSGALAPLVPSITFQTPASAPSPTAGGSSMPTPSPAPA